MPKPSRNLWHSPVSWYSYSQQSSSNQNKAYLIALKISQLICMALISPLYIFLALSHLHSNVICGPHPPPSLRRTKYQITNMCSGAGPWPARRSQYPDVDYHSRSSRRIFIPLPPHFYPLQAGLLSKEKAGRLWLSSNYSGKMGPVYCEGLSPRRFLSQMKTLMIKLHVSRKP